MKLVTMSRVQSLRSDTLYDHPHVCVPSVSMMQCLDMLFQEMQSCKISFDCVVPHASLTSMTRCKNTTLGKALQG